MKPTPLLLASLISAALVASRPVEAVHINPHGLGQVLIFPYYTVRGGNQTLVSVINTSDQGKAVGVAFREGRNGRIARKFNLYLAPFDTWTAAVFDPPAPATGPRPAALLSHDDSCTAPRIKGNPQLPALANGTRYLPFLNYQYTGSEGDGGPRDEGRTAEGYFELIEMGEVVNRERTSLSDISPNASSAGVPQNCQRILDAWNPLGTAGYWVEQAGIDIDAPGGGLYGAVAIVDASNGTMLSYPAEALDGFSTVNLHTRPGDTKPDLSSALSDALTDSARAQLWLDGAWVELDYPASTQGVDAVSALLNAEALYNDFVTSSSAGAASEWVLSFPTKHFYTQRTSTGSSSPAVPPFVRRFNAGAALVDSTFDVWDRNGGPLVAQALNFGWSLTPRFGNYIACGFLCPPLPAVSTQALPWATTVLRFNQVLSVGERTQILGSELSIMVPAAIPLPDFPSHPHLDVYDGRMRLNLYCDRDPFDCGYGLTLQNHIMRPDRSGRRLLGLPVMGFWAASYTNSAVTPGVLANYSGATRHRLRQRLAPSQ